MQRGERRAALKEGLKQSLNGKLTYVLLKDDVVITQDTETAVSLVHEHGYRVYAKCINGHVNFI